MTTALCAEQRGDVLMFTRFSYDEIAKAAPPLVQQRRLCESTDPRDRALYLAICSLERIAGADSPEGDSPEVDALRNLGRIRILVAELNPGPADRRDVNLTALSSTGPRPNDPQPTPDAAGLRAKEQHRDG